MPDLDDRCDCGAPWGVAHACSSMPTMADDDMHPLDDDPALTDDAPITDAERDWLGRVYNPLEFVA